MTLKELTSRYIRNTEKVLKDIRVVPDLTQIGTEEVKSILETAHRYLQDAKYYRDRKKLDTSLASVAYCEGLLDALRFLGVVKFSWPKGR